MDNTNSALNALPWVVIAVMCLFVLGMMVLMMWLYGRIFAKAGHSPWLALLFLVPLANLALIIWFALSTWPIENEVQRLRQLTGGSAAPGMGPGASVAKA